MTALVIDKVQQRKSRIKLLLVFFTFFGPLLLASILLHLSKTSLPSSPSTHGELIIPATPLTRFSAQEVGQVKAFTEGDLQGKWTMLTLIQAPCEEVCSKNLYHMRQVRLAVAQNMDRVQRVAFLVQPNVLSPETLEQHEGLRVLTGSSQQGLQLMEQIIRAEQSLAKREQAIYLIDPLGNLMMRFNHDLKPKGILKDLKHLLKVSRIG